MSSLISQVSATAPAPVRPPRLATLSTALRRPAFVLGLVIVAFWVLCALAGDRLTPNPWDTGDILAKNLPPSGEHWFGTDRLGRDVFARVIVGSRDVLRIAPAATIIGIVAGGALGLVMGYFRSWLASAIERVVDALLALPALLVALTVIAARGRSATAGSQMGGVDWGVVLAIAIPFTPIIARTVRAAVLVEREEDYVQAARLRNERAPYVMFAEILPNVTGPILVEFTVRVGYAIFAESALSFLGAGVQPPSPDWGLAVFENRGFLQQAWWTVLFPCLAIASLVVAINLVADGLQESGS